MAPADPQAQAADVGAVAKDAEADYDAYEKTGAEGLFVKVWHEAAKVLAEVPEGALAIYVEKGWRALRHDEVPKALVEGVDAAQAAATAATETLTGQPTPDAAPVGRASAPIATNAQPGSTSASPDATTS